MKLKLGMGVTVLYYMLQSCPVLPFCHFSILVLQFCEKELWFMS